MVIVAALVFEVNTNRDCDQDWDRDFSNCRDPLLKPVKISSTVEINFLLSHSRFTKLRLLNWDFVMFVVSIFIETQDCLRFIKISQHYWALFERLQVQKSWPIEKSWSRLRQTVKIYQKCQVSTDFSISIETFGTGRASLQKILYWSP